MNTKLIESLAQIILSLSDEQRILLLEKISSSSYSVNLNNLRDEPFVGKLVALQKGLASRFVRPLNLQKRDAPKQAVKVEVKSKAMR